MGYILTREGFDKVLSELGRTYRLYAPVRKTGEGRFTDTDVIRYDFVNSVEEMELDQKSDYAFKEILTPLSETLFFFTESEVKTADRDAREAIIFVKSCDMHAVKRLDQIYLDNTFADPFYKEIRERVHFVLLGDPALRLAVAELKAVVDSFNGADTTVTGAAKAGSVVTVSGHIECNGERVTDYRGILSSTVFDNERLITCRDNQHLADEPFTFRYRDRILYSGTDSVRNGEFRFLIKYLLGETLLHCIPYGSHHPCRPSLVEPLQHDAKAAVDYIIDGLGSPSLVNHFKWCTLKPHVLCQDRKNG